MTTLASIDIGTNTFRLLISDLEKDGVLRPRLIKREITRLGGGFSSEGMLTEESMERSISCLAEFSRLLLDHHVDRTRAVATSVVREAGNGRNFLSRVKDKTGIDVNVIDGNEEALLALRGMLSCVTVKTPYALAYDIGGGSTEYIVSHKGRPVHSESLKLGVVHAAETFLKSNPTKSEEVKNISHYVEVRLKQLSENLEKNGLKEMLDPANREITLVGTAGTITTLAAIDQGLKHYDPSRINNYVLTRHSVKRMLNLICPLTLNKRRELISLEKGREDLIVAGAVIVLMTMEFFGFERMLVSDGGLLEGVLIDMVENS